LVGGSLSGTTSKNNFVVAHFFENRESVPLRLNALFALELLGRLASAYAAPFGPKFIW
jgi:hypothetical protein